MKSSPEWKDVDQYIAGQLAKLRPRLRELRAVIRRAAPDAEEGISYCMPAYKQHGVVAYFAGFKNHCSLFPTSVVIRAFQDRLGRYEISKGTVRFPIDEPVPERLIAQMVKYHVKLNLAKAKARASASRPRKKKP